MFVCMFGENNYDKWLRINFAIFNRDEHFQGNIKDVLMTHQERDALPNDMKQLSVADIRMITASVLMSK